MFVRRLFRVSPRAVKSHGGSIGTTPARRGTLNQSHLQEQHGSNTQPALHSSPFPHSLPGACSNHHITAEQLRSLDRISKGLDTFNFVVQVTGSTIILGLLLVSQYLFDVYLHPLFIC